MRNGQLKPAYNVQVGTEKGFVTSYGIYPNPTDTRTLADQLNRFHKAHGRMPKRVVGDAGYGSEENYTFLEDRGVVPYLKYGLHDQEKKRNFAKRRPYHSSRWPYDEEKDQLTCPQGYPVEYEYTTTVRTDAGYQTRRRMYVCRACNACPVKDECTRATYRKTAFSPSLRRQQGQVRKRLASGPGSRLYARRGHEVETVFAQIKSNQGFDRFQMRGTKGASVEWGLQMLGYNMKQLARTR